MLFVVGPGFLVVKDGTLGDSSMLRIELFGLGRYFQT
jgi:hypothetical protein